MIETRIKTLQNIKIESSDIGPTHVIVKKIDEEAYSKFVDDCQKVLATGQNFMPVVIDSYGGYIHTIFGMMDFLKSLPVKVITICHTKAMSAGSLLFTCGEERYASPLATFMVHEVSSACWGKEIEIKNETKELTRLNTQLFKILDANTGQKKGYWKELVDKNMHTDLFLTSKSAKKHKLATEIAVPRIETEVKIDRRLIVNTM